MEQECARGMFQKSVVLVSRYPYVNLFERLVKVRELVLPIFCCERMVLVFLRVSQEGSRTLANGFVRERNLGPANICCLLTPLVIPLFV